MKTITKLFLIVGIIGFALFGVAWLIMMWLAKLVANEPMSETVYYSIGTLAFLASFLYVVWMSSKAAKIAPDDVICMHYQDNNAFDRWNSCAEGNYQKRFGEPSGETVSTSFGWGKCHTRAPKEDGGHNVESL